MTRLCRSEFCQEPAVPPNRGWYCSTECRDANHAAQEAAGLTGRTGERFWGKVNKTETCWLWTGAIDSNGYGMFRLATSAGVRAHTLSWVHAHGPVPDGLELDHLCRVRHCLNPAHLEPVTSGENTRRGTIAAVNTERAARRTHCVNGHPWDEENTYVVKAKGWRMCRACARERARERSRRYGPVPTTEEMQPCP